MAASNMALSVADGGHKYAISAASSPLTPTSMLAEMFDGMQQVCVCVCVCMYVCVYVCVYVRTYVCTYVRMYVRMCVCLVTALLEF